MPRPRQDLVLHRKLRSFQLDAMLDKSGLTLQGRPFSKASSSTSDKRIATHLVIADAALR